MKLPPVIVLCMLCATVASNSACSRSEAVATNPFGSESITTIDPVDAGPFADLSNDILIPPPVPTLMADIIAADNAQAFDHFGSAVAMDSSGRIAVIGSEGTDSNGTTDSGALHVLFNVDDQWWPDATLNADFPLQGALAGNAVDISADGNTIVAGSPGNNTIPATLPGSVLVFERFGEGWQQTTEILFTPSTENLDVRNFGQGIQLSDDGNTLFTEAKIGNSTVIIIYQRTGSQWSYLQEIAGSINDFIIAGNGQRLFIADTSARKISQYDWNQGLYTRTGDALRSNLTITGEMAANSSGDLLLVSQRADQITTNILHKTVAQINVLQEQSDGSWNRVQTLIPSGVHSLDSTISLASSRTGDAIAVGLSNNEDYGNSVSWFTNTSTSDEPDSWRLNKTIRNPVSENNEFAKSLAINADGDRLIVGAPRQHGVAGFESGVVYSY